jgi:hypothetical protein
VLQSDLDLGSSTATSATATAAAVAIVTAAADLRLFCLVTIATAAVAAARVMHLPLIAVSGLPLRKSEGDRMFVTMLNLKCCPRVTPSQVPPAAKSLPVATKSRRKASRLYKISMQCSTSFHMH